MMDDQSLATILAPNDPEEMGLRLIRAMTPEQRAGYERLAEVAIELESGVIPPGVIVCRERGRRR